MVKQIKQFLLTVTLLVAGIVHAQTCTTTRDGITTCHYNIPDDGHAIVPIPFGFPFYGEVFTHSIFFDNGAVSFYSPTQPQRWGGGGLAGITINESLSSSFFYTIMPLRTDLIANGGTHFTQGNENFFTYNWNNVSEFGRWNSRNTFSVEIRPTGYIGLRYDQIDLTRPWTSAIIGNASVGEFQLIQSQPDWGVATTSIDNWSIGSTGSACVDPLSNINCPGYADAFFQQQCSISALHNPACPGYAEALLSQQCSLSALYSPSCPGYAVAFLEYQCSLNALYSTTCVGYDDAYFDQQCGLNPLYDSDCIGYDDAFYVQQCNLDPLYDPGCTGYDVAFYDQQCSLNTLYDSGCPGYETAFFNQQCSLSALHDPTCPGYDLAFFDLQCSLNTLHDSNCPGYEVAFFDQQCSLNGLYDRECPNYNEAYAKEQLLSPVAKAPEPVVEPVITQTVVEQPTSTASPADVSSPVQLVAQTPAEVNTNVTSPNTSSSATNTTPAPATQSQSQTRTTRQALAEARLAALRAKAVEDGHAAAENMDSAASMEDQIAVQDVVIQAMGFNAAFDAYGKLFVPDGQMYRPFTIYDNQRNVDNRAVGNRLFGASDRAHSDMVDAQYQLGR